ncbi:class F sortase [Yimella sp. cx-51]|uniref:class F sortase n=1 Tax=Yimella sp. cx-51 TaxID=2770551 RepID=UPI00165DDA6E|nr:class F sortase [Yimella sp. cx-51]MBC9956392.1 class F sortase [Yimella sp. cx-51]QTH38489.1 class F sortase [Yimella sp. cx-51]
MRTDNRLPFIGAALAATTFVGVAAGCGAESTDGPTHSSYSVAQYTGGLGTTPEAESSTASQQPGASAGSTADSSAASSTARSGSGQTAAGSSSTAANTASTNKSGDPAATGSGTTGSTGKTVTTPTGSPTRVYVFDGAGRTIVNAPLIPTYLDSKGVLEPPGGTAGWYAERGWALPGHRGAAILVGHVTNAGVPDTFYNLVKVTPGNKIIVAYSSGQQVSFTATGSRGMSKEAVPKDRSIWASGSPSPVLRLITCDPATPTVNGHLKGNWVVWANLS